MILILEDDEDRVRRFRAAAAELAPDVPVRVWRNAATMMNDLVDCLEHATLMSLDHDLNPSPTDPADPGTGYDVIRFLAELEPCCPLILHTSNGERGNWMSGELSRTRWRFERVYPNSGNWIETAWVNAARQLLGQRR